MQAFPFDSKLTYDEHDNPIYDRAVSSQPLRELIRGLFSTGVMPNPSTCLQVSAGTDGMTVKVAAGFAVVDGGLCKEKDTRTLEVTAADNTYDRIDTVVVRWNENVDVRTADLYVVAGTPAVNPVRPTLQRNNSIYEIGLADVFITKRVATITNDKITDTRYEAERCGIVSSISKFDTTTLYQQIQADLAGFKSTEQANFLTWYESIRNILDKNAAGHLQNEIDDLDGRLGTFEEAIESYTNGLGSTSIKNVGDGTVTGAIKQLDNDLTTKVNNFTSGNYKPVTGLSYNVTTKKLGLKVNGADSVIPFSSIGAVHLGRYSTNETIDVTGLGATSVNQFLVTTASGSASAFSNAGGSNITSSSGYQPATLSLSGNTLTVTAPTVSVYHQASGGAGGPSSGRCTYDVYFVGDIREI